MPKFTGGKANFDFDSITYFCLQDFAWSGAIQEAAAACSAATGPETHRGIGATDDSFTFNILVDEDDVTTLNALKRGGSGAFEFHPQDSATTGDIEFTAANVIINSSNMAGATGSLAVLTVVFGVDGLLVIQAVP